MVSRTSQIYGSDVAQPQIFPAGQRLDDDPSELLRRRKATFRNQCKLESLVRIRRRLSHTTGRHLHILCLNSRIDIGRRKAPYTHQLRVEPDTHAVIIGSEHRHTAYSRQTGQLIGNVQLGIIRQKQTVIQWIIRFQRQEHDDVGRLLLRDNSLLYDSLR